MKTKDAMGAISSMLDGVIGLGMSLAVTFLVVDLLFPGTTNIVSNVASLVNSFVSHGLVGLITLIVFVSLYSRD